MSEAESCGREKVFNGWIDIRLVPCVCLDGTQQFWQVLIHRKVLYQRDNPQPTQPQVNVSRRDLEEEH